MEMNDFVYFLGETNGIVLVHFVGSLKDKASLRIKDCIEDLRRLKPKGVIISFRDSLEIEHPSVMQFHKMQKLILEMKAVLYFTGIHPNIREMLEAGGVIQSAKISNNIQQALAGVIEHFNNKAPKTKKSAKAS